MKCPNCGSRDIDFEDSVGRSACVECGTVLEENTIVSSIEFQDSGGLYHYFCIFMMANNTRNIVLQIDLMLLVSMSLQHAQNHMFLDQEEEADIVIQEIQGNQSSKETFIVIYFHTKF